MKHLNYSHSHPNHSRPNYSVVRATLIPTLIAASMLLFMVLASQSSSHYVSSGFAVTERVINIPFEQALVDYCATLNRVQGVTGVSYRDYDILQQTAIVTVHYNPGETTPRQIRTYLGNTRSIWEEALHT